MVDNMLGMLVGAAIDREDGDSGIKGAIIGSLVQSTVRVVTPLLITFAIGWGVQFAVRKGWQAVTGDDPAEAKTTAG